MRTESKSLAATGKKAIASIETNPAARASPPGSSFSQQVENYWLSPKLSAKTMTLNGGVAFGAALAGGAIAGPMGAFTALPVAALISSFMSNYLTSHEVVYQSERREKPTKTKGTRSLLSSRKAPAAPATELPSGPGDGSPNPSMNS